MMALDAKSAGKDANKITTEIKAASENDTVAATPSNNSKNSNDKKGPDTKNGGALPFEWMVKPCYFYKEEYSDCKSIKARFHQYFIHGESQKCEHWNEDFKNCTIWETSKDEESLEKLVESEKERVRTRLRNHYANDVWENRDVPPEDWNKELPLNIQQGYESSFLKQKNDGLKGKEINVPKDSKADVGCAIM